MNNAYTAKLNADRYLAERLNEAKEYRQAKKLTKRQPKKALISTLISIFR